jgi:hypothetical protein
VAFEIIPRGVYRGIFRGIYSGGFDFFQPSLEVT